MGMTSFLVRYLKSGWGALAALGCVWIIVFPAICTPVMGVEQAIITFLPLWPLALMWTCLTLILCELGPIANPAEQESNP